MIPLFFLLNIKIDFDQSHLFFPKIIFGILLLLGFAILILYGKDFIKQMVKGEAKRSFFIEGCDKVKLMGTFFLIFIYFLLLEPVGKLIPNTGFGFVMTSIIFIFCTSLLYMDKRNTKNIAIASLVAILAPTLCWYILGYVFNLTLP